MKGILIKTEKNWMVYYKVYYRVLESDYLCHNSEVEFDVITQSYDNGRRDIYAKVINHIGDSDEMVSDSKGVEFETFKDHVPDAGNMVSDTYTGENLFDFVCTTPDCPHCGEEIRLMQEDDEDYLEELAEKEYELQQKSFEDSTEMFPFNYVESLKAGFIDGYNKAKETLYTEEQVREIATKVLVYYESNEPLRKEFIVDEIIQSLKKYKQ